MPLGWWTDLEVARRSGSRISSRGEYTVVRTPHNPGYYWGNCIVGPGTAHPDAARAVFAEEFPRARHEAIGLLDRPEHDWPHLSADEVRRRREPPVASPVADYAIRPLSGGDWRQAWERETAGEDAAYADFAWRRIESRQQMVAAGDALFAGAFDGDDLVADLGIVMCGSVARYQSVSTDPDHRGRGLASWLLACAALWAQRRGADQWVILCEPDTPASRLYDHLGFSVVGHSYQMQRVAPQGSQ